MGELYEAYGEWARRSGFTLTQQLQGFRRNLENLGLAVVHGNQGNKVVGLRLTSPAAPAWPRRA